MCGAMHCKHQSVPKIIRNKRVCKVSSLRCCNLVDCKSVPILSVLRMHAEENKKKTHSNLVTKTEHKRDIAARNPYGM